MMVTIATAVFTLGSLNVFPPDQPPPAPTPATAAVAPIEVVSGGLADHHPGRVLVRLRDDAAEQQLAGLLDAVKGTVVRRYTLVPGLVLVNVGVPVADALTEFGARTDVVRYVEPDYTVRGLSTPNDPEYPSQFALPLMHLPVVWDTTTGDQEFLVAVVDSGIEEAHPDLVANLWTNPGEIEGNGVDDDHNGFVDDVHGWNFVDDNNSLFHQEPSGHGTHLSGIIAARGDNAVGVTGICWQGKIVTAKFLVGVATPDGGAILQGNTADAISGFEYAIDNGAKISNASFGGPFTQAMEDAMFAAAGAGHLVIAAAGNILQGYIPFPAASESDNVISVTSAARDGGLGLLSNRDPFLVDIGAPGEDILSTIPGRTYGLLSGDSQAAAQVTGVAAILWPQHPEWTYHDVRNRLLATVRRVPGWQAVCSSGGIVDAAAAMQARKSIFLQPLNSPPADARTNSTMTIAVRVDIENTGGVTGIFTLHYRPVGEPAFASVAMTQINAADYTASVPTGACPGDTYDYYFSTPIDDGLVAYFPHLGELEPLHASIAPSAPVFADGFDADRGWVIGLPADTATAAGRWARATPQPTPAQTQGDRHSPTGVCYVTGPESGGWVSANDVDGGATNLVSPRIDLTGRATLSVGYWVWYSNDLGANPGEDSFRVYVSSDDGATWQLADTVTDALYGMPPEWTLRTFTLDASLPRTAQFRLRFEASDFGGASAVEAAIDDVYVSGCDPSCIADFNGQGGVTVEDIFDYLAAYFSGAPAADVNGADGINVEDIFDYLAAYFTGCS